MPFIYDVHNGQYLEAPSQADRWTSGPQQLPNSASDQALGVAKFALGVGAATLFGRHQFSSNKYGWDYILHGVRAIEEYSPGSVFKTFQVSHMLSALESPSRVYRHIDPEQIDVLRNTKAGQAWLDHISKVAGRNVGTLRGGFRFESGQLRTGRHGGEVLVKHASVLRAPSGTGTRFQEAYARSLAGSPLKGLEAAFTSPVSYLDQSGKLQKDTFMITGGPSRLQSAGRFVSGYGTSLVERFNQLARAPFELPIVSDILNRLPVVNRLKLDVVPSSGLKTFGRLAGKMGIASSAMYLAYQQLDYSARESSILDDTIFAEGITAGIATVWTKMQMGLSQGADLFGLHEYRERQQEIAPRSTEISTIMGFPLMGAFGGLGIGYAKNLTAKFNYRNAGLDIPQASRALQAEHAFMAQSIYGTSIPESTLRGLDNRAIDLVKQSTDQQMNGWLGKISKSISSMQKKDNLTGRLSRVLGQVTPKRLPWLLGAAAGTALVAPFIPGALVPGSRPEELEALYSGEEKVAIRKGRFWEMGRSPWEGKRISRYQEHWYPRMLARSKEKAIWGEDAPSPLEQWYLENFTYELEKRHAQDRPYPISSPAFQDVPLIGPLLSSTIGRLVKPPVLMHTNQWIREGGGGESTEVVAPPLRYGETVTPGELPRGEPISPYGLKGTIGEQVYRMSEMVGLPGFTMTSIKKAITGEAETFAQEAQLEASGRMYGAERSFWDKELGGMLGTNEGFRRLFPHRRREIELYNPIPNAFAGVDWLPGAGDKSPNFKIGDPFVKIPEGESRLPGAGYAARFPELKGVAPGDYPLIHRFAILADTAPYSDKFKESQVQVRTAIKKKQLSSEEIALYKETLQQIKAKKTRREFSPYQYRERARTPMEEILAAANEGKKTEGDKPGWFERTVGSYWETLTHSAETPFEYLTPISPANKLIHMRTAVEDYEKNQAFGRESAFWDHPIRDFFGPFFSSAKHSLGSDVIPGSVQEKRDLEEYFDILKYVKFTRLKRAAQSSEDEETVEEYEDKRRETLFGINPYTYNFSHIFRALPRRDRDYLNSFMEADMEERAKIVEMVPENEQALLMARWKLKDASDMKKAIKKGLLSDEQIERAKELQKQLYKEIKTEGMPKNDKLWQEYIENRLPGESYPDWYRRTKLLPEKLEGRHLPGPDWVGWNSQTSLEDIKLKIVTDEGKNAHDYDLWPDRHRAVARRPQIQEAAEELQQDTMEDPDEIRSRIDAVLLANNVRPSLVTVTPVSGLNGNTIDLQLEENRSMSSREDLRRFRNG